MSHGCARRGSHCERRHRMAPSPAVRQHPPEVRPLCDSSTPPARPASTSATSTARVPTSIWSKPSARVGCSSTTTTMAGSTSSLSMAVRWPIPAVARRARHRLFRNRGNGTFQDVTAQSGIQHRDYGMGACAGDYDNDGRIDLYVTNVGPNMLYRNAGNGAFTDVTRAARVGSPLWSTELRLRGSRQRRRPRSLRHQLRDERPDAEPVLRKRQSESACLLSPAQLRSAAERRLPQRRQRHVHRCQRRSGVARFAATASASSIADYDDDGWPDVFVANDSMPNFLFRTHGTRGASTRSALRAGVAVAERRKGARRHGHRRRRLRRRWAARPGRDQSRSRDVQSVSRTRAPSCSPTRLPRAVSDPRRFPLWALASSSSTSTTTCSSTWRLPTGTSWTTLASARGSDLRAAEPAVSATSRRAGSPTSAASAGPGFALEKVEPRPRGRRHRQRRRSRSARHQQRPDGGSPAQRRRQRQRAAGAPHRHAEQSRRHRRPTARDDGTRTQIREVKAGSSYLGQNDLRQHFGLGTNQRVDRLEVRWPSGRNDVIPNVSANQIITIREGEGIVRTSPFAR